jgi:competence CoiA-like predicted nuclease
MTDEQNAMLEKLFGINADLKVPFAYDETGKILDPQSAEKSIDYKCECGAYVRVRGGEKTRTHFYHISATKCLGGETIIHKAYKQVFFELKQIRFGNGLKTYYDIDTEKKINAVSGHIIADAIGYIDETAHIIEFAKTSKIDNRKKKKLQEINLLTIEILIDNEVKTLDDIRSHLIDRHERKHIIHVPDEDIRRLISERLINQQKHDEQMAYQRLMERAPSEIVNASKQLDELKYELKSLERHNKTLIKEIDHLNLMLKEYRNVERKSMIDEIARLNKMLENVNGVDSDEVEALYAELRRKHDQIESMKKQLKASKVY